MNILNFNQKLTILEKTRAGGAREVRAVENWTRQQVLAYLDNSEGVVGKIEITQENERGVIITENGLNRFMVIQTPLIQKMAASEAN